MPVLVEERDRGENPDGTGNAVKSNCPEDNYLTGRLDNNLLVHFKGSNDLIGQIINVKLSECKGFYYFGDIV